MTEILRTRFTIEKKSDPFPIVFPTSCLRGKVVKCFVDLENIGFL